MTQILSLLASVITVGNFIYAVFVFTGASFPVEINIPGKLTPGTSFVLFFLLEIICSYFICKSILIIHARSETILTLTALFFGIINVATTLFNYKYLFYAEEIKTGFEATLFACFVFGAFLVDAIVIHTTGNHYNHQRNPVWKPSIPRFYRGSKLTFLGVQFIEYFLAGLYIVAVGESI